MLVECDSIGNKQEKREHRRLALLPSNLSRECGLRTKDIIVDLSHIISQKRMKISIDVLMIVLLVIFISSFAAVIIYGEFWRINLLTESAGGEPPDMLHAQIAFVAACIGIGCGGSMLFVIDRRLSEDKGKGTPVLTSQSR
jgi:hypothetical protein